MTLRAAPGSRLFQLETELASFEATGMSFVGGQVSKQGVAGAQMNWRDGCGVCAADATLPVCRCG